VLIQADLSLKLLPLCLRGDGHSTSKDHVDFSHLPIVVERIVPAMFASMGFLGHLSWWWWHLLVIQKSFALFQNVSSGAMDLTPLFYVVRAMEGPLLLLIRGLLLVISVVFMVSVMLAISSVSCVDFWIVLLLL
jgi:hypothetical protein